MTKSVDVQKFESNGEVFEIGSYHGISILIRKSDGYINATKLCKQFNKPFRQICVTQLWQEFYEAYLDEFQENSGTVGKTTVLIYELKKGYSQDFYGQYIHPKLLNGLISMISPKYLIHVSKIMDLLNERIQITNEDQNELIKNLQNEIDRLKKQIEQQLEQIQTKTEEINQQSNHIRKTSTPIANCNKRLFILELKSTLDDGSENLADNNIYYPFKLCADSSNSIKEILRRHKSDGVWKWWVFPAGMNMKQLMNKFNYKYYLEHKDLVNAVEFIRSYHPKQEY